jgi:hypothetical protein
MTHQKRIEDRVNKSIKLFFPIFHLTASRDAPVPVLTGELGTSRTGLHGKFFFKIVEYFDKPTTDSSTLKTVV